MGNVEADGETFTILDYENNPQGYAGPLSRAKAAPGYAKCQCNSTEPKLVIRRIRRRLGDYYLLAKWPMQGGEHDQRCRFGLAHESQAGGNGPRIPAVVETEEGFSIRPDFSLRRLAIGVKRDPAEVRPEVREQAAQPQRARLGLLGTLYYLWESAGLNQHSGQHQRAWATVYPRLNNVVAQGTFGKAALEETLYLVPPFQADLKFEIDQTWQSFIDGRQRTQKAIPMFLVLGEIKEVSASRHSMSTTLRHHKTPLYMDNVLADAVAARYPSEEAAIRAGGQGRVIGLFLVERSSKGYLNVQNAALMLCSKDYIPCDSSHEVRLADEMADAGRMFEKPMFMDHALGLLPDFVDRSAAEPVYMEVWGMSTDTYLARKQEKIAAYRAKGLRLWEWYAVNDREIPRLP